MVFSMCGDALVRSSKKSVSCLQSSMVVVASWSGAAWVLLVLGSCGSLRETWIPTRTETVMMPSLQKLFSIHNHPKHTAKMTLPCWWSWRWRSGQVCLQTWTLMIILKQKMEKHHVSNNRYVSMEEWKRTPATACAALVNSMPSRIKAVLDNNGAPTKYWHFGHSFDMFT